MAGLFIKWHFPPQKFVRVRITDCQKYEFWVASSAVMGISNSEVVTNGQADTISSVCVHFVQFIQGTRGLGFGVMFFVAPDS